jgi:hypothetical protein
MTLREQADSGHDLAGLAIAALGYIRLQPRLLDDMQLIGADPFDGDDLLTDRIADQELARARRFAVDMDRASAALCDATAEFCPGEAEFITQEPKHRGLRLNVELMSLTVDRKNEHVSPLFRISGMPCRRATLGTRQSPRRIAAKRRPRSFERFTISR